MITEKMIQNEILDNLEMLDVGYFWQNDSMGYKGRKRENRYRPNGVPDILGITNGQFIGIEVKKPKGKMSTSQIMFREKFVRCGGLYILAYSYQDVFEVMKIKGFL